MPIIINQIKAGLSQSSESIISKALRTLRVSGTAVKQAGLHKVSLDARRRDDIHYVCSVFVRLSDEAL